MNEFELIQTYFASQSLLRPDVRLGIGDDAAVVAPPTGMETAMTTDVLVAGVHFFENVDPEALGYKSLAVNLSDLAAMGAEPAWFLINLTLPDVRPEWLKRFAEGMFALARQYNLQLIGGDTSRGPLAIGITVVGLLPRGEGLCRSGARSGDAIFVTGTLGDAALALEDLKHGPTAETLRERLERPTPRVTEGLVLRSVATSAIDVSDGLLGDLGHILAASHVGAEIRRDALPLSSAYRDRLSSVGWDFALNGGDDYELCFTVPREGLAKIDELIGERKFQFTRIGEIISGTELLVRDETGKRYTPARRGHDHFAAH